MPVVTYKDNAISVKQGDSVLETLEKAEFTIPFSCRAGVCHSCIMQTEEAVPKAAQEGLSASQVSQGYFLACSCYPVNDISVRLRGSVDFSKGKVIKKTLLNQTVLAIFIQVDFRWFPGQYLTLWKDEVNGRSYSIASRCDNDKVIELHVKRHEQGLLSRWLHDDVVVDDILTLSLPLGDCFYTEDHHNKPMIMACTGTGLAPLYGILQEALLQQHAAPIVLYAASGEPGGLYYREVLQSLAEQNEQFSYIPVVRRRAQKGMLEQDIIDVVKEKHPDLSGHKIFICGAPNVVKTMQRNCFFQGAAISGILVDAFEMTKVEK
ncbi:hypothetical protein AB835_06870 [Candidatus Endobugula sertula]|uniref:Ferredoxin n=1 Tax=Candidatus Endobugula sertula TaxID=62101 RepID=A0A1D2QQJ1_9GAMM|nr:hypothetical protein AB835_06870 [Candidatus Endobugula sertula]